MFFKWSVTLKTLIYPIFRLKFKTGRTRKWRGTHRSPELRWLRRFWFLMLYTLRRWRAGRWKRLDRRRVARPHELDTPGCADWIARFADQAAIANLFTRRKALDWRRGGEVCVGRRGGVVPRTSWKFRSSSWRLIDSHETSEAVAASRKKKPGRTGWPSNCESIIGVRHFCPLKQSYQWAMRLRTVINGCGWDIFDENLFLVKSVSLKGT